MKILKSNLSRAEDPTQQGRNRDGAIKYVNSSADDLASELEEWILSVPTTGSGDNLTYLLPEDSDPNSDFENSFLLALMINGSFFSNQNVESAFRSGVLATQRDLLPQIEGLSTELQLGYNFDTVFQDRGYRQNLLAYQASARDSINGVAKETVSRVSSIILLGMAAGASTELLLARMRQQMEIMKNKIKRILVTTINQGLNLGKLIATDLAADALGYDGIVQHVSALIPTTRPHHAARHKKFYTVAAQSAWWSSGSNRINCYCSIKPTLKRK